MADSFVYLRWHNEAKSHVDPKSQPILQISPLVIREPSDPSVPPADASSPLYAFRLGFVSRSMST